MNYTHSLCDADTYTGTGIYTRAQKGAERQRHREACCDDLGCLSSATALPLKGVAQISHAGAYTNTPTHLTNNRVSQLHRKTLQGQKQEKTSHPHNLPFPSLHPLQTSLFPSPSHASCFTFSSFLLYLCKFLTHFLPFSSLITKCLSCSLFFHFLRVGK